ncbi:hypothetical protein JX265_006378 [Neoarthrinium moseri]|uniref:Uncharacterized protein n=1 Tax=Neoarthrinium moseri TaxID=1658444 RepID=A0A9P9WLY8_9PEZI|nr:hypothetical protein JX266_002506 [Neoarthrinium moseri]KAI1870208.1 hypothetical protein JX265_006378 [Neoarthrinium moseri]
MPRKKAPTPEGNTDSDTDNQASQSRESAVMAAILAKHGKIRTRRAEIRKQIEQDYMQGITDLKARVAKHYETESAKRSEIMSKQLDQLSKAIEKKAECEVAILKLMDSLADEGSVLSMLMSAVHSGRRDAVNAAATSYGQGGGT